MVAVDKLVNRAAGKMRFPWLVLVLGVLFVADVFIPDAIPFVDEILLALLTLIFSRIRTHKKAPPKATTNETAKETARETSEN